jgi:hypothetical protein
MERNPNVLVPFVEFQVDTSVKDRHRFGADLVPDPDPEGLQNNADPHADQYTKI